jgi:hypothetical protein
MLSEMAAPRFLKATSLLLKPSLLLTVGKAIVPVGIAYALSLIHIFGWFLRAIKRKDNQTHTATELKTALILRMLAHPVQK